MDPWNHATPYASSNGSRYGNSVSNFGAPIGGRYENPLYNFEASNRKDTRKKNKCKRKKRNKSSTSNTNSRSYTLSQNEKLKGGPIESTKSSTRCIEVDSALGSDCVRESKLRGRDSFFHKNHNSVVVKTEVGDDSFHTGCRSAVVKTEVEDDFAYKGHGSAIIKTEVEDGFSHKNHNSVVVKPEVEETSDFEELFDYQGKTRSGKRYRRPDWEHVVEPQHEKQNVSSDRMQLDWARGQINGNKASKKQKKSTKKQKSKKQLNRMVLNWSNASKLMDKDGDNFLQTLGEETNLKIRVEYHGVRFVCAFHGASDWKAKAQEAVKRFLYPILFKSDCSFVSLRKNLEILDSSEKYWTHLASLRYHTVQKRDNLLNRFSNNRLVKQVHRNYSVLNAMVLGKLDVADGPNHMQILRQWLQQSNEFSAMTRTIRSSFNYVFNYGSALDIDYSEVIKRFSNGAKLQEKIEIKGILESGVTMCNKHGWKKDLNYYKSLYEKIIINNYSTDSVEQFKKNHAELKAKMKDWSSVKYSKE